MATPPDRGSHIDASSAPDSNPSAAANAPAAYVSGRPDPATMSEADRLAIQYADEFLESFKREWLENAARIEEEEERKRQAAAPATPTPATPTPNTPLKKNKKKNKGKGKNKKKSESTTTPAAGADNDAAANPSDPNEDLEPDLTKPIKRLVVSLSRNFASTRRREAEKAARKAAREADDALPEAKSEGN